MSILKVDTINEKTSGNGVYIPNHTIQTVRTGYNTYTSSTSTSLVATGLTATITPTSTSSKILINVKMNGMYMSGQAYYIVLELYRGSSSIKRLGTTAGYRSAGDEPSYGVYSNVFDYSDSPSTTSATTYTVYWQNNNATPTAYLNNYNILNGDTESSITLTEIAQ